MTENCKNNFWYDNKAKKSRNSFFTLAILLFIITAAIRLYGIHTAPIQSDEPHWASRSSQFLRKLKTEPLQATTHLGHPGVTATIIMATGQWSAEKYNHIRKLDPPDPRYLDRYSGARIANAIISSLVAPLLFILLTPLTGLSIAFVSAFFLAFDPIHIFHSRIAHVDSILTLLTTATVLFYFKAVINNSVAIKILAALAWGLCIAIKPTALSLVLVFLLFKAILKLRPSLTEKPIEPLITWSDLWAVVIGQGVLLATYTRLWHHPSEYLRRLHINCSTADLVYDIGRFLNTNFWFVSIIVAIFAFSCIYFYRRWNSTSLKGYYHTFQLALLLLVITTPLTFAPQLYENLIRFWLWVFSLANVSHDGFGGNFANHPLGYTGFLISTLPTFIIVGFIIGTARIIYDFGKKSKSGELPQKKVLNSLLILTLITVIIWLLPLSLSPKQSVRYSMPVLPLIYIIATWGIFWIISFLNKKIKNSGFVVLAIIFITKISTIITLYPNYELYLNTNNTNYEDAIRRGQIRPLVGMNEAVEYLIKSVDAGNKDNIFVSVVGDADALRVTMNRHHPVHKGNINFGYFPPYTADYLFTTFSFDPPKDKLWQQTTNRDPLYQSEHKGLALYRIWNVPVLELDEALEINVTTKSRETGKIRSYPDGTGYLFATPKKHLRGHIMYAPQAYKFAPGHYKTTYTMAVPILKNIQDYAPNLPVATISFGRRCTKDIFLNDLMPNYEIKKEITIECSIVEGQMVVPRVYWLGRVPFELHNLTIAKVETAISETTTTNHKVALPSK